MSDHLITRPARAVRCHGCGSYVLAAVVAGRTVAADIKPLTLADEIRARLTGKHSYDIAGSGNSRYLIYRDVFRITERDCPVVGDHGCGALPRYQLIPAKTPAREKRPAKTVAPDLAERIPF